MFKTYSDLNTYSFVIGNWTLGLRFDFQTRSYQDDQPYWRLHIYYFHEMYRFTSLLNWTIRDAKGETNNV